ncbi:MAG: DNA ligase [Desulfocapsa sp.]|nr:DNA ligase [Desulfocapsa sp.]
MKAITPHNKSNTWFLTTFFIYLLLTSPLYAKEKSDMMLPRAYNGQELVNWLWSEKLDGIRGRWTGNEMLTKQGNIITVPPYFTENFPPFPLDGEIWGGRQTFEKTSSIVSTSTRDKGWDQLQYGIFDAPEKKKPIEQRLNMARKWFAAHPSKYAFVIAQKPLKDREELKQILNEIEDLGGEGIVVIKIGSMYVDGRSMEILKVKKFHDAEAIVVDYTPGKGKHQGRIGSIVVELASDRSISFSIGTGLSDKDRQTPPPLGAMITFKYTGFYLSGKPKFPSFLRVRRVNGKYH